jgi:fatty acid desaturase
MKIFQYKEDRLPVLIFTLYFLADFLVYLTIDNIYLLVGWFVIGIFPKANICAWNHHHQHYKTFKKSFYNWILEFIYSFHTGITSDMWVLHHNYGHHLNYLDQEKDESRWKDKKGNKFGALRYTLNVTFTSYWRAFLVGKKHRSIMKTYLIMFVITGIMLVTMLYFRPLQGVLVFILPMLTSLLLTSYATYSHHSDLEEEDHMRASRNIESKWYNKLTGNLGYHTAHHLRFGLHWSKLPQIHKEIRAEIPEECIIPPTYIFRLFDKIDFWFSGKKVTVS